MENEIKEIVKEHGSFSPQELGFEIRFEHDGCQIHVVRVHKDKIETHVFLDGVLISGDAYSYSKFESVLPEIWEAAKEWKEIQYLKSITKTIRHDPPMHIISINHDQFWMDGVLYERVPERRMLGKRMSPALASIMMLAEGMMEVRDNTPDWTDREVVAEYKLIQQKQSKLSAKHRELIKHQFGKRFRKVQPEQPKS